MKARRDQTKERELREAAVRALENLEAFYSDFTYKTSRHIVHQALMKLAWLKQI